MQILFVENHATFADIVVSQFLNDHHVLIVPSISDAECQIAQTEFDLLLVDFDLDDGNGAQLIRRIRDRGINTKIISVSSHSDGNNANLAAGANGSCPKTEFESIQNVISEIVGVA